MKKLLTIDGNPKLMKGNKLGYLSAILHLAPADLAGFATVCAHSTEGCRAACLNTAGRGGMFKAGGTNTIQEARKRKTAAFYTDRETFLRTLVKEVKAFIAKAERKGAVPCVRLNGTSDILWEHMLVDGKSIMAHFPSVQFYDYTKYPSRRHGLPNYHLTFSLAENNDAKACVALASGVNVAVVFGVARSKPLPATYAIGGQSFPVVNGDDTDLRFLDAKGCIVGLRAKGRARKDTTGFVRTP
jgi:hypothetical protein